MLAVSSFSSLKLSSFILSALERTGYSVPTPIQAQAIPPALEGRDLQGCAQTGTGKTAAFALPIIHRLSAATDAQAPRLPRALILSPTRELASQIAECFTVYGHGSGLRMVTVFGGVSQGPQVRELARGVDIVVATPGRLMDLMEQRAVRLSSVQTLVLDEADRMLDMGFIAPIRRIAAALPASRQTLLFSATMPREIEKLAASLLRNPVRVAVTPVASAAPRIEQRVHAVSRNDKPALLVHLLKDGAVERAIVFVRTKHGADRLCRRLAQQGLAAQAIHGNRNQNQRQRSLDAFRGGKASVLVATDVAARGIDIDGVTHVFNFDLPNEPEAYVHRIGRTGRAGAAGVAIAFCDPEERALLRGIERLLGAGIPSAQPVRPDALRTEAAGQHADAGRASTPHHGHAPARRAPVPHPAQRAAQARKAEAVRSPGASRTRLDHEGGPKAATRPGLVSGARRRGAGHGHRARGAGVHPAHSRG